MILEWEDTAKTWYGLPDVITFEMNKVLLDALGGIGCLKNTEERFYYSKSNIGSTVGLIASEYDQAWVMWGVKDDS